MTGDISQRLAEAGRIDRFYIECEDCGVIVLDSAKMKLRYGAWGYIEGVAKMSMREHMNNLDHDDFEVVIQDHRSSSSGTDKPTPNVTVTTK